MPTTRACNRQLRPTVIRPEGSKQFPEEAGTGRAGSFPENIGTLMQSSDVNPDFSNVELLTGRRVASQL